MGTNRQQLPKRAFCSWLSRLSDDDMRRHIRCPRKRHNNSGQSARRDIFSCCLYRYPLFFIVQIQRTCKVKPSPPDMWTCGLNAKRKCLTLIMANSKRQTRQRQRKLLLKNKRARTRKRATIFPFNPRSTLYIFTAFYKPAWSAGVKSHFEATKAKMRKAV